MKAFFLSIAAIAVPWFLYEAKQQIETWRRSREIERRRAAREAE